MQSIKKLPGRRSEATLLALITLIGVLAFLMTTAALHIQARMDPLAALQPAILPPLVVGAALFTLHLIIWGKGKGMEQVILPVVALLFTLGLVMIWRLNGDDGAWQQILRGFLPGLLAIGVLVLRPDWIEVIRRWAVPISLAGLGLAFLTALFGVTDESGARLALKLGPLPAIQTSELIKLSLIIFLAWYIDREGEEVEGRARPLIGGLRLPAFHYFIPGVLFVTLATLALVGMSDFGAVLILAGIFVAMLYAGFDTRVFIPIATIGLGLALIIGVVLLAAWDIPTVIRYRFIAFVNPWSSAMLLENGQATGITVAAGPGYQIQQAIYAVISGGLTGTGLGYGSPYFVPLAASDFIFAAVVEELGALTGIAILVLFTILILRIFRVAVVLPRGQTFERLLLIGIGVHLFVQVFVMVGGTLNLLPLTGITIPFMSQGGMALLVNLAEVGLALGLAQRVEAQRT
jgi:cell division protein FtsW (lipid II flippase)